MSVLVCVFLLPVRFNCIVICSVSDNSVEFNYFLHGKEVMGMDI